MLEIEHLPPLQLDTVNRALRFWGPASRSIDIVSPGGTLTSPGPLTDILPNSLIKTCKVAVEFVFRKVNVPIFPTSQDSCLLQETLKTVIIMKARDVLIVFTEILILNGFVC